VEFEMPVRVKETKTKKLEIIVRNFFYPLAAMLNVKT